MSTSATIGVIVGNRGFFPAHLCSEGRAAVLRALEDEGIRAVALDVDATPHGAVESLADARRCADLFRAHRDDIDDILVTLPNFGDERAVANTLRWAGLDVPVLVHAFGDAGDRRSIEFRRDSFCGKMSVCNNLLQYGIPYSLTALHTVDPESESFRRDLRLFAAYDPHRQEHPEHDRLEGHLGGARQQLLPRPGGDQEERRQRPQLLAM